MDPLLLVLLVSLSILVGTGLGILTGLVPGFHTNNICAILLTMQVPFICLLEGMVPTYIALLLLVCLVVSAATTHTFVNFIPATFLGAPEGDTALSVLPGHRMLMEGRGELAVRLSSMGSLGALLLGTMVALLLRPLMGDPVGLYSTSRPFIPLILLAVALILVLSEGTNRGKLWACLVLMSAGCLGLIVLGSEGLSNHNWVPVAMVGLPVGDWALMPLFVGLFGLPTLLISLVTSRSSPPQPTGLVSRLPVRRLFRGVVTGTFSGALVGWYPGVTSAQAGILAARATPSSTHDGTISGPGTEEFIVSISAINTANAIANFVALYTIGNARSGSAKAVKDLLDLQLQSWGWAWAVPEQLVLILVVVLVSGVLAYLVTRALGRFFARHFHRAPYRPLLTTIVIFLVVLIALFSGPLGLAIMAISTVLGMIPPMVGIRRVHLMGCLILPIIFSMVKLVA